MIRVSLGNVGSGKTANEVREMFLNRHRLKTYSNIHTKLNNQIDINSDMIFNKTEEGKFKLNIDYWRNIKEPIQIVLDEAHSIINSRRSMSKANIVITDWIALIRRVLGESDRIAGDLVLITQLPNRIDSICREMANQVRYHICHYYVECLDCGCTIYENSEMPEPIKVCPECLGYNLRKTNHQIEIKFFQNMEAYNNYKLFGFKQLCYKHYFVKGISKYFDFYDTLQWDNMFSQIYS